MSEGNEIVMFVGSRARQVHICLGGQMSEVSRRTARLNMRLTPDALELLREVSQLQNQDLTTFVLGAAIERGQNVISQHRQSQGRELPPV